MLHTIYTFASLRDVNTVHGDTLRWNVVDKRVLIHSAGLHERWKIVVIERKSSYGEIHAFFQLFCVKILFHDTLTVKMR